MKKVLLLPAILTILTLACGVTIDLTPNAENPTAETTPAFTEPATPTPEVFISRTQAIPVTDLPTKTFEGLQVMVAPVSFVLPPGLANGVSGEQFPPTEGQDLPYWELTPGHVEIKLEGYALQNRFHEPKVYAYPAGAYAEMFPGAFESIRRLDNILYAPGGPTLNDELPTVPFFNAAQVFAANIQLISFQNGGGVRFVTEYSQYFATINNTDLFYHFEGVTRDGAYYIVAILPVSAPVLAETSDYAATVPAGGIAPPDINDPNANWKGYYDSVQTLLNNTSPESFQPALSQLDALIQSMLVNP
ncbi:MAG: hypothetical protein C3F07_13035 [Anaerolineales bacterium]|nr:MAG: hypothetical protein C3F07_13035 [Anaerolineales bacterium]